MKKSFHLSATGNASRDVRREIELHLELRAKEFEAMGMTPESARRAAIEAFGDRSAIESEVTQLRTTTMKEKSRRNWRDELQQDVAIGLRGLRRAPAFTLVALLTLAIGIGANTAIFSVFRSILIRPLPYTNSEQLVQVWSDHRAKGRAEPEWLSPPDYTDWRDGNRTFSAMAGYQGWAPDLTGDGDPESLTGAMVSGNMFEVLNTRAALGRLISPADDDIGAEPVVVISDALWKRRFGSDTSILGRPLLLNSNSWKVIGVMPAGFRAPMPFTADIIAPIRRPPDTLCRRGCIVMRVIGRLKPNVSLAMAHADLSRIAVRQARDYPRTNEKVGVWLIPLQDQLVGESKPALFALAGAVAFVLLIGCVNLANLLLVRGAARARELSVRAALGAGRERIMRQLLTENILLAATGGALGIALGVAGSRVIATLVPESIRRVQDIRVDAPVLLFALGITVLSALMFGWLPAMQAVRADLMGTLRHGARETGRRGHSLRSGLVVAQLSLAVVLLVGAGLLLRSFMLMNKVELGYRSTGVAMASVAFPRARYIDATRYVVAINDLTRRLRAHPAIRSAELTEVPPLSAGDQDISVIPEGEPVRPDIPPSIWYRSVSPDYLKLMRMRIVAGRAFNSDDREGGVRVAIINEEAARRFFPGKNAVGRKLLGDSSGGNAPSKVIVGVVASVRHDGPNQPFKPEMFLTLSQFPARAVTVVIEPARDVASAVAAMRQALKEVDPLIPVPTFETIESRLGTAVSLPRLYTMLVGAFAVVALLLAVLGVYGVMAYTVTQRHREIGVRLALGAQPTGILRMVLGQGTRLAAIGILVGLGSALMVGQLMQALLFGVTSFDWPTFAGVGLVLGGMTLLASWLPARRAMAVDPNTAIRDN
ncbi:MAG: ABC transporter permease [Phycisphaerae bacterium]|nr:ABC transporter permease [Gemmatimonadaceae bacterium]